MQTAARRLAFSSSPAFSSSSSPSKRVLIGLQSNFRGWSKPYTASDAPIPCKPQRGKRMPIKERRALVESFVDKYQVKNAGRFPCASIVQQEIGGSYYVIRQLVQELQYHAKLSSSSKGIELLRKAEGTIQNSDAKELPSLSLGDEIVTVQNSDAKGLPSISVGDEIDTVQNSDAKGLPSISVGDEINDVQNSDAKEFPSISIGDEILKSNIEIKDESSVSLKSEMEAHTSQFPPGEIVHCKTEMATTDSSHDAPCGEEVQHKGDDKALKSEEHQHPIDYQSSEQGDSPRATSLWSTLRSLADGIIGFWRKN